MEPGAPCEECLNRGLSHKLRYFYINLEEQVLKCESRSCLWPLNDEVSSDEEEMHQQQNDADADANANAKANEDAEDEKLFMELLERLGPSSDKALQQEKKLEPSTAIAMENCSHSDLKPLPASSGNTGNFVIEEFLSNGNEKDSVVSAGTTGNSSNTFNNSLLAAVKSFSLRDLLGETALSAQPKAESVSKACNNTNHSVISSNTGSSLDESLTDFLSDLLNETPSNFQAEAVQHTIDISKQQSSLKTETSSKSIPCEQPIAETITISLPTLQTEPLPAKATPISPHNMDVASEAKSPPKPLFSLLPLSYASTLSTQQFWDEKRTQLASDDKDIGAKFLEALKSHPQTSRAAPAVRSSRHNSPRNNKRRVVAAGCAAGRPRMQQVLQVMEQIEAQKKNEVHLEKEAETEAEVETKPEDGEEAKQKTLK